ncbi:unnamed protein product [Nesidiocoris tenuis]|uniref:Uncharacterized protein n=1 Tax=Nesidiocoris tenuis TaxID=355587 RepID=A0A6H5GDU4_9HEMI|nr:unnamed protein product [Nesidiocoris tenuis]
MNEKGIGLKGNRPKLEGQHIDGELVNLHFVKTATVPMAPYVTTLNFHDISNVHVQVRNWRCEVSPLRRS